MDVEDRWICTSGESGLDVKMKEGKRAICCSLYGGGWTDRGNRVVVVDDIDGEGEGVSGIVACDKAFPFDLRDNGMLVRAKAVVATYQFVPSLSIIFQSTPSFLTPYPTSVSAGRRVASGMANPVPSWRPVGGPLSGPALA